MAVKLGRIVFRRIRGRLVPIRKGTEAAVRAGGGVSSKGLRKLKTLLKSRELKVTKKGNIKVTKSFSGDDLLRKFMKQSGAARVNVSQKFISIDTERQLSFAQIDAIRMLSKGKEVVTEAGDFSSVERAIQAIHARDKKLGKLWSTTSKQSKKITQKAEKFFGTGGNPEHTGFITTEGKRLNLASSEAKRFGSPRDMDHREAGKFAFSPEASNPKAGELSKILKEQQKIRRKKASLAHSSSPKQLIKKIKDFQKSKEFTGEDRGIIIKSMVNDLKRRNKGNLLKQLKKRKK